VTFELCFDVMMLVVTRRGVLHGPLALDVCWGHT
jgi:hypothetical protein